MKTAEELREAMELKIRSGIGASSDEMRAALIGYRMALADALAHENEIVCVHGAAPNPHRLRRLDAIATEAQGKSGNE